MDRLRTRSTNRNIHPAGSSEILCLSYYLDHNHLHSGRCLRSTVTSLKACTCMYRKLNPNVLMMKSAQDGVRIFGAESLNRTRDRRILLQRPMRSNAVVKGRIVFQNPAQMFLAQDNDVV